MNMHVLHMVSSTDHDILVPVIVPNEAIDERTERNEVMGLVLFDSTEVDRLATLQAYADSIDADDSRRFKWVEVTVPGRG
jgi:hypothetical protein